MSVFFGLAYHFTLWSVNCPLLKIAPKSHIPTLEKLHVNQCFFPPNIIGAKRVDDAFAKMMKAIFSIGDGMKNILHVKVTRTFK